MCIHGKLSLVYFKMGQSKTYMLYVNTKSSDQAVHACSLVRTFDYMF